MAAFAAWFVNCRFSIALGVIVLSVNGLTGNHSTYPYGPHSFVLNYALKLFCVMAVAVMLGLARRALEREWQLARTDPLTGALNRQAFFEIIEAATGRKGPAILAFADVDGLKRLNDEKGHELGDKGLRDFANRVTDTIRQNDLFARIGGDEFVIFMKVKDERAARTVANRLNQNLNSSPGLDEAALKCSLGILFLAGGSSSIDAELKLADKLMYSAKRVRAGYLMATAQQMNGRDSLSPALETALPANLNSVIRQRDGGMIAHPGIDPTPGESALAKISAV
ncbi:GGDEF domain-containing protein [Novosphingobium sp. ZN18A2]|uniref:GGDEF domain-containing protein n=1 Tax=Novosphingobium sp. ZN18A2 TaxID=3079861 RepID=UPI0030CE945D